MGGFGGMIIVISHIRSISVFYPLVKAFAYEFEALGYKVVNTFVNSLADVSAGKNDTIFVVGGHNFSPEDYQSKDKTTVVFYNTENPDIFPRKADLIKSIHYARNYFDNSSHSLDRIQQLSNLKGAYLPFGYSKILDPDDIDPPKIFNCTFIGSRSDRRGKILDNIPQCVWITGAYRENFIKVVRMSRINLNVHFGNFGDELVRISQILSAGGFVMSEPILSGNLFDKRLTFTIDVGSIKSWIGKEKLREEMRIETYNWFKTEMSLNKIISGSSLLGLLGAP